MPYFYYISITVIVLFVAAFVFFRRRKRKTKTSSQHYPENEQLYVGNLSYQMTTRHLKEVFSKFGSVQNIRLIKNTKTGRSKGFAFVTYDCVKDAKKALSLNGQDLRGRTIVVRMAKPREE